MGIGADFVEVISQLRLERLVARRGAVMEIGAQQLDNSFLAAGDRLRRLGLLFGINRPLSLPPPRPTEIVHGNLEHLDADAPRARDFWHWLGFKYAAIDIDGSPDSIPLDLNYDGAPAGSEGQYAIVTNFGTTEHIVNQLNAFKVIHDLTAVKGLMVHQLPAQGCFNHGLFNYNFKFFWMLARSNGYRFVYAGYDQGKPYPLPDNIVDFVRSTRGMLMAADPEISGVDSAISVILQKTLDFPFVPPLDVATDARTDIEILRERYWSVFEHGVVGRMADAALAPKPKQKRLNRRVSALAREERANGVSHGGGRLVRDWPGAAIRPHVFRETILANGAVMLRNAVDPRAVERIGSLLNGLFDKYATVPEDEFARHLEDPDPAERDFWTEIKRGHIFDRTFKRACPASFFDLVRDSGLWDLAAQAFPEADIVESDVANCRRIADGELHQLWDMPVEFHIDAAVFYDNRLSINFWTPLVACGSDAPGLQVVPIGVAETRAYLEHNPVGYPPQWGDFALMHKFRCAKMALPTLDANGLLARSWAPEFQPGDVLAFTNFTMHATHYTPAMTRPRLSVEVRVDLPGYDLDG